MKLNEETPSELDLDLIDRIQKGEEDAFTKLVQRYQKAIYYMALRIVGSHEEADDLAQQAFINAFRSIDKFERRASVKTWLCQIVINLSRNYLRDRARRPNMKGSEEIDEMMLPDPSASPMDILLQEESSHHLKTAIASLPEQQRITLTLRAFEEESYENIANIMHCLPGTARANYHHAIMRLKKMMTEAIQ